METEVRYYVTREFTLHNPDTQEKQEHKDYLVGVRSHMLPSTPEVTWTVGLLGASSWGDLEQAKISAKATCDTRAKIEKRTVETLTIDL